jgi:hypothetical protein
LGSASLSKISSQHALSTPWAAAPILLRWKVFLVVRQQPAHGHIGMIVADRLASHSLIGVASA